MSPTSKHKHADSIDTELDVTEQEPFLSQHEVEVEDSLSAAITPLPKLQLALLAWIRLAEPCAFYVVFPFLPAMVIESGIVSEKGQAGYFAGIVESMFALTQFCTLFYFGRASDRVGRKPVLAIGLLGSAVSQVAFGLSSNFWLIVASRCLNGALNGNAGCIRSMIAENTDKTNQARAFTLFPIIAGVGSSLGPLIGGYLADPATKYATLDYPFLRSKPYFLPCFVSALIPLSGFLLALPLLKETLPPKLRRRSASTSSATSARLISIRELLSPQVRYILLNYSLLILCSTGFLAITPLFTYTDPPKGLGFSQSKTGTLLAGRGAGIILVQVFLFPPLERRYGAVALTKWLVLFFPLIFALYPAMLPFAIAGQEAIVWTGLAFCMALWSVGSMAFSCNSVLVTEASPSRNSLGALNGLVQSCASLMRALTPALASTLFALSVDKNVLNGNLIWVFLIAVGVALTIGARFLREGEAAWRKQAISEEES